MQVKIHHQRSPYAVKIEDRSQEETERQQGCARGDAWKLAKNIYKLKETEKATFYSPSDEWVLPAASTIKPDEREFVVDYAASMHMVSKKDLSSAELETVRISKSPTTVVTANGEVLTKEEATVYVRELDLFVTVMLLEDTPAVLSLRKLCECHGNNYHWTTSQKPHHIKNGRKIDCNTANYVPFVVPSLSTSSSTSSSPTSSSQESVTPTEHPASTRSESMSEELQRNLSLGPAENENPNTNDDNEDVRGNLSHDLPEWLQEFRQGPEDESVPEHRDASSSSHEVPSEPRAKVVSGNHSIFTHFPKDRNCDICLRNKITRASCRKRTGTVVPRAKKKVI